MTSSADAAVEADFSDFEALLGGEFCSKCTPPDIIGNMARLIREILSEPAVATKLQDSQQMTLLLANAKIFDTFFSKQVSFWGQVVRENNIWA